MKIRNLAFVAAALASFVVCSPASAQIPINVPPIVSYYEAPPAYGVYLPASLQVGNSYYGQVHGGMGGTYYPIPSETVSYFHPSAAIIAPVKVRYGLFGRTYVRSPFYRVSFNY